MLRFRSPGEAVWTAVFLGLGLLLLLWTLRDRPPPPPRLTHLESVLERGVLRVATVSSPLTYFAVQGRSSGLDFDLARDFANDLGVKLEVTPVDRFSGLIDTLLDGRADLVAASMTVTRERAERVRFGPPYQHVTQELIVREGSRKPSSPEDLVGLRIRVIAGSSYEDTLADLRAAIPGLTWESESRGNIETIFEALVAREIDATVADSTVYAVQQRFFPRIRRAFTLSEPQPVAWAFPPGEDATLAARSRSFFNALSDSGRLDQLRDRYLAHIPGYDRVNSLYFMRHVESRLRPLLPCFHAAARQTGLDWKLLAAMAYQESHWDPQAVSPTGVRGVMMLTRATAGEMGVTDRGNAAESIAAGARYLRQLREKIPDRIEEPDRTWLALAAYNVGFAHLEDARIVTQRRGGNPDRWRDVARHLPLLSDPEVYRNTRYGYARGEEPVRYVRNIRSYYDVLNWAIGRSAALVAE